MSKTSLSIVLLAFLRYNMAVESESNDYSIDYDNQADEKTYTHGGEVTGGERTLVNYPYSASIQRKSSHYSSGALVSRTWVLTAAFDMYNVRESIKLFKVRLGSVDCKKGGSLLSLKSIEIHPDYEYGSPSYDVSMLKLADAVNFTDFVRAIALPTVDQSILTTKFYTSYWPRVLVKGRLLPDSLRKKMQYCSMRVSSQRTVPWKLCRSHMLKIDLFINDTSMCLKPMTSAVSPCLRDVGAPVVAHGVLWGVTSGWVSSHCKTISSPTIVTKTAARDIHEWIDRVLFYNS